MVIDCISRAQSYPYAMFYTMAGCIKVCLCLGLHMSCLIDIFFHSPNIHKGRWTEHEDAVLRYAYMEFAGIPDGEGGFQPIPWNRIAERIPNRTGIQCQARWTEALDPSVRKGKWSEAEDALLRAGVDKFGRCWIRIAETVPGRTQVNMTWLP